MHEPEAELLSAEDAIADAARLRALLAHGPELERAVPVRVRLRALLEAIDQLGPDETLTVDLEDGRTISVPNAWYPRLAYGTPAERANFQISGASYGIWWNVHRRCER